jgi:aspartyl-tRNA(Asn)/glutamyl-tRNA(Gln) amidotransferase subunit A
MTSNVTDSALILEVISGHDEHDSTSSQRKVPQFSKLKCDSLKGLKIGMITEYNKDGMHADVVRTTQEAIAAVKKLGAEVVEVSVPFTEYSIAMYYLIAASEASSNLARYDGVRFGYRSDFGSLSAVELDKFYAKNRGEGFGSEVQRRIMIGTYALSSGYYDAYYNKACQVRRLLTQQFQEAFNKSDVILSPVCATPAFKLAERISDPLQMYLNDIFTTSTNLAGLPGMSLPYGLSSENLPIGIQLTAAHFNEEVMLKVALALEAQSPVVGRKPHDFQ